MNKQFNNLVSNFLYQNEKTKGYYNKNGEMNRFYLSVGDYYMGAKHGFVTSCKDSTSLSCSFMLEFWAFDYAHAVELGRFIWFNYLKSEGYNYKGTKEEGGKV